MCGYLIEYRGERIGENGKVIKKDVRKQGYMP
jgi:hypothetical protein